MADVAKDLRALAEEDDTAGIFRRAMALRYSVEKETKELAHIEEKLQANTQAISTVKKKIRHVSRALRKSKNEMNFSNVKRRPFHVPKMSDRRELAVLHAIVFARHVRAVTLRLS